MNPVFRLEKVSVSFARREVRTLSLRQALLRYLYQEPAQRFVALSDLSLEIRPGEHVGVIGRNGAGKSTLLRVLARVITPQRGVVSIDESRHVVPMLELGIGFHPDLSGRENCALSGLLMGYTRKEMEGRMAAIAAFSELEEFFDQPVRFYSSGMYARLAFALATDIEPDVLLVDEVFGVGDEFFMRKCLARMDRLMKGGTTTVFVSHDLDFLVSQCDRLVWLDKGRIVMDGSPGEIAAAYRIFEMAA
jgi:ABC-type polysaccharide/polyol phosphate transport system ATPase subunit